MHDVDANDCVDIVQSNTAKFRGSDVVLMLRNEIQTLTRLHYKFDSA